MRVPLRQSAPLSDRDAQDLARLLTLRGLNAFESDYE